MVGAAALSDDGGVSARAVERHQDTSSKIDVLFNR
jgi:hypothetical protein